MARENQPFEDVSPIKHGEFPLRCVFSGGGGYALLFYRDVSTSLQALQALLLSSNVHEKRLKAMDSWNRVTLGGTVFFCSGAKFHLP